MTIRIISAAALLLLGSQTASSTEPTESAAMIVTATRTAQTADQVLASVSVVTRLDIERLQLRSLQDALRGMPGISVASNGGPGKNTSVFMRGTESDHVLVLIDGIKVGSATAGTTAFQDIPIEQIERIEVVRGPRSSLYGSEAIGGVIQIFTRKGHGEITPSFSIGTGSDRTYKATIGLSGSVERGWFSVNASGLDTQGFNSCTGSLVAGCFTIEPDTDPYRNLGATLRAGYRFDNGLELEANLLRTRGENKFDGGFVNESETIQQLFGGSLRFAPLDNWQLTMAAGRSRDESENFKDGAFFSRFDTERDSVSLQNDLYLSADHIVTLGADYQNDKVDSSSAFTITSRHNSGVFAQYQTGIADHSLQASVRRDENEQFGGHTTGGLAWGYSLSQALKISASYGTAFKAPSFNELFFPGFSNPNLRPETSRSYELGLSGRVASAHWSLNAYETRIDDLIAFDATIFLPANISEARIRGLEATLALEIMAWQLNTNISWMDPENRANDANRGNVLPRRAEQSLRLDADRQYGKYRLGASVFAVGSRFDDVANSRELAGYVSVDLRAEYALNHDWRLQTSLENLFDRDYQTAAFFNQQGRSVFVTLRYQP